MSVVINFREEDAFPFALADFTSICGFKPESEKHKRMLDAGMGIRERGLGTIEAKALLAEYGPDVVSAGTMEIGGVGLRCDSLYQMDRGKIRKVLLYIVTAGECGCDSEDIMDRLYADFWGTAYVDAAYELLRQKAGSLYIGEGAGLELSSAFGPGYFGMPTEEVTNFFQILDGEKIGVKCLQSCVMVPIKSCVGILYVMEKGAKVPESSCMHCVGNRRGCQLCGKYRKRETEPESEM
ncbi:MAG: hypothetical protein FWG53_06940 [Clostridiales bacterium]|nr:hypothetical protein [Clostridiales bacterium]